ncbi:hypothetical protein [Acidovorax sp. NCPPB 4044]|uniref:hypothetical protein n=1 Tax=Acidovorax sp. NCPPB 4044 TaxID=2940490 RepID=UPI002302D148|nr:hypothetical protein [Acidovorax sp. NCPPB 4044]MDA8520256.1 hypothetical protein [Acidovorax sp. NCPPB 4044]
MPADSSRNEALRAVRALQIAPLHYNAIQLGIAPRRFLSEVLGLSETRLASTAQTLRPGTILNAQRHAITYLRQHLVSRGYPESAIDERIAGQAQLQASGGAAWAGYWYAENFVHRPLLDECVRTGIQFDVFLADAEKALVDDDLAAFTTRCADFIEQWTIPADVAAPCQVEKPSVFRDASTWDDAWQAAQKLLLAAFFDQFAQFDAVWGGCFITHLPPRSLVALIAPKWPGGPRAIRPVRRLIVLSFSLHHWVRYKRWPDHAPGATEVAQKLMSWGRQDIANLFDGTKRLRFPEFEKMWDELGSCFGHGRELSGPFALARIAIAWQRSMMVVGPDQKLRSFTTLGEDYHALWGWRHSQRPRAPEGAAQGREPWPLWLDD